MSGLENHDGQKQPTHAPLTLNSLFFYEIISKDVQYVTNENKMAEAAQFCLQFCVCVCTDASAAQAQCTQLLVSSSACLFNQPGVYHSPVIAFVMMSLVHNE